MPIRLRIRGPNGVSTLSLSESATVGELRKEIIASTGFSAFELKSGYPPQTLDLDQFSDQLKLTDTGTKFDGQQFIVNAYDITEKLKHPLQNSSISPQNAAVLPAVPQTLKSPSNEASLKGNSPNTARQASSEDPPEMAIPSHSATLVMRVMPDDNSCMFRALSSAVLGSALDGMTELRMLVASQIQADRSTYTAAILDKDPDKYCAWITRDDAWGGAIELGILSQHFDLEICSINVQDGRVDKFNEGRDRRIILVYSGIHYDVMALSPSEPPHNHSDLPADFDVKVFDADDDVLLVGAQDLCSILKTRHYYTDTTSFDLKCNVCGFKCKGERQATEHATQTGHMDFGEAE